MKWDYYAQMHPKIDDFVLIPYIFENTERVNKKLIWILVYC